MPELAIPSVQLAEVQAADPEDPSARRILLMIFSMISFATTLPFVIAGAWPIAGFMGVDVALFYFAFRANFNAAKAYEDVRVTPIELLLAKVSAKGHRAEWRFNPSWVRLDQESHEEYGVQRL